MRIGFDFRMGGIKNAGIGRYAFELLRAILEIDKHNEFIIFYNPQLQDKNVLNEFSNFSNIEWVKAPYRHYSFSEQTSFVKLLYSKKLDLIHFPNFNVPILYRKPFVVTIHDAVHHILSGHKKSTYYKFLAYKLIIHHAALASKAIITVSQSAKVELIESLKVKPEKVYVTYEAGTLRNVSENFVASVKADFLLSRPYFLFVGTLERKKNLKVLLAGFDLFLEKFKLDLDLVIAGKPDSHYPNIKYEALASIKKPQRVVFTGFVDDLELSALYQGAFAYVSASKYEGFGLPGVEALGFGLPLVTSNIPCFNEVYDNAAIYFDPSSPQDLAEKLGLLASDVDFYKKQQQASCNRFPLFSWANTATQTLAVYKTALPKIIHQPIDED